MACIKGASRSAFVGLAPDSPYMAAGTMFGAVDQSFSSSANLEIFKLDFLSDDRDLPVVGECPSSEWFSRLSWGKTGSGTEEFSLGLIAGGLVDGSINLWNPLAIMHRSDDLDGALVGRLQKHSGLVRGLEFNINSPNLLASGAEEGEICIWDLSNPLEPTHYPSLKGAGSGSQSKISFLSWNHKVQHILASTSSNGTTVVWDLKRQKPVISFSDSNRRSCSVLQWNPDLATQLIVASDNDSSPSLKLWDVRNTMSPLKEFVGHTKGVIAMSWCPVDSSFLLSCSKDSRTICWDTVSGEIVCELPPSTNWNFDVHWYPKIPGVISASSFDGKIGIYNIEACSRSASGEGDFAGTLSPTGAAVNLRAPKWLKRPTGLSFGFGGKLVSFHNVASSGNSDVFVHATVTELELVSRSTEFETAIQNGERSSLRALCEKKSQESESEDDRETWGFLKVMFEDDGTARTKLVAHLGFSVPAEMNENVQGELIQEMNNAALDERTQNQVGLVDGVETNLDNGEDFFNNLQSPKAELLFTPGDGSKVGGDAMPNGEQQAEVEGLAASGYSFNKDDMGIHHALVVGDYKGAVSQCISLNRMADALIIAYTGGAALLESTCNQLLKKNTSSYAKTLSAMVNHDLMNLVTTSPLNSWKETLVFLCTFAQKEEWTSLCDTLASRLMSAGNTLAATLCYICAGNVEKTVEIWSRSLKSEHEGRSYVDLLQDLMEKTIILALATGQKRFSASLSRLVENYAELLASQGLLTTAIEFLKLLGPEESSHELAILQERLALSADAEKEVPKKLQFENGPPQTENIYHPGQPTYNAADPSQHYYQESMQQHQHPSVPTGPYDGSYQHSSHATYGGGYQPLQPSPQTQMFVPTPTPQVPQATFAPSQATSQPATRAFVPSNPPALKNVVPYPQPTLGSQLYPGVGSSVYQPGQPGPGSLGSGPPTVGSIPSSNLPSVMTPTPTPTSFMPVTNPGFVQRPGVGPVQPPSPTMQPTPPQTTVAPPAPPPTVQTVDTSKVPAELKPVIATLTRLYNETSEALGGSRANPAKKREIEDNSRKIGALFARLNNGDISQNAATKLGQLCQALDSGDFAGALHIQVVLTTSDWDECNFWLAALKRMIKTRQGVRL